jgi:ankyrin repeat protein
VNSYYTALMDAAGNGHAGCVNAPIAAHAHVDAKDHDSMTALMAAANSGSVDLVQSLIAGRADVKAADRFNRTALSLAEGHIDIAAALGAAGAR